MKDPIVSIIVPIYNTEKFLSRCLDSILTQTYTEWEAILVDDGSTDDCGKICDEYCTVDKRFKVIHQRNQGLSASWLAGFNASTGDYITIVDSDDYISELYLEKLLAPLLTDGVDFTCCQIYDVYEDRTVQQNRPIRGKFEGAALRNALSNNLFYEPTIKMAGMPLFMWGKMYKRVLLENAMKAALSFWYQEDQVAILTILYNSNAIYILPEPLHYYCHHDEQITRRYRADKWEEMHNVWLKLLQIDKEHLIEHQLPYRIWILSVRFYYESIVYFQTFDKYLQVTKHIFESELLRNYVFSGFVKNIPQNRFEKVLFILLKYKLYRLLYLEVKRIRKSINHG